MLVFRIILASTFWLLPNLAQACGWWGDSEMSSRRDTATVTPDGTPVEHSLSLQNMKLPGRMGYGIAVPEPGKAIPYLLATFGQPLNKINELKIFGFKAVIDLGTAASSAKRHRLETQAVGMDYFNILVEDDLPNLAETNLFTQTLLNPDNTPLLVYAHDAKMIAALWASYRIQMGSPLEFSLQEGRALGLTDKQEAQFRKKSIIE